FAPYGTGWVAQSVDRILANKAGIVESQYILNGRLYQLLVTTPADPVPLSESEWRDYTQLPDDLAGRIRELSHSVCGNHTDPAAKALAVAQYFTSNYGYSLDFSPMRDQDPLEQFLFALPRPA